MFVPIDLKISINDDVLLALNKDQKEFLQELKLAAAVKWYEMGMVSQAKAAEIAGLSRTEFIYQLSKYRVSPFQYTIEEIKKD